MSNKFLSGRIKELPLGIAGRTEDKTVLQTTGTVGIGTTNSVDYTLYVNGSTNIDGGLTVGSASTFVGVATFTSSNVYIDNDLFVGGVNITGGVTLGEDITARNLNLSGIATVTGLTENGDLNVAGVSTFQDRAIFDSTNSIQIPVGTEAQKDAVGVAVTGQVRFNTTNQQFEGFGVGNNWGSLGGVKDVDGDTEIKAELSAGSDEDALFFYTGGNLSGILSTTSADFNVDLNVDGNLDVTGVSTFRDRVNIISSNVYFTEGFNILTPLGNTMVNLGSASVGVFNRDFRATKDLYVENLFNNDRPFFVDNSGSSDPSKVGINSSTPRSELDVRGNVLVSGVSTFQSNVHLGDNDKLKFGDDDDLEIFHNSSNGNTIIQETTGGNLVIKGSNLFLQSSSGEDFFKGDADGAVTLYYDDSKKFETTGIGVSVSSGAGLTATIAGPTNLILDPAAVGDNTGIVRIKGDLYVDGTEVKVDSTTINLADLKIGIATNTGTNLLLDGGGIGIGSANIEKTILWNNSNSRMEFNADLYAPNFTTGDLNASTSTVTGISTNQATLFAQQLNVAGVSTFNNNVNLLDNDNLYLGTDQDLRIYHSGSNAIIRNNTGGLFIDNEVNNGDITIRTDDGSGGTTEYIQCDGSRGTVELYHYGTQKFETTATGIDVTGHTETDTLNVSGVSTFQNNVHLLDNDKLLIGGSVGTHDGLEIYHDSNNSYITDSGSGNLLIGSDNDLWITNAAGTENS